MFFGGWLLVISKFEFSGEENYSISSVQFCLLFFSVLVSLV